MNISDSQKQAAVMAAGQAAKIALESARRLIVLCHGGKAQHAPLAAYHALSGTLDSHMGHVDNVRSVLQRCPVAGGVRVGDVYGTTVIEVCWEYARRVFLTAMSGLQCFYAEHQIDLQHDVSFEEWSGNTAAPTAVHDAAIREVIKTHYPRTELKAVRTMVEVEVDRDVARILSKSGIAAAVSQAVGDGTGETVTVGELAHLVGRTVSHVSRLRRVRGGPEWRVVPLGARPGRMDFRETMEWARAVWGEIDYPHNRAELETLISRRDAS